MSSFQASEISGESSVPKTATRAHPVKLRFSPSILARKILCSGYIPAAFGPADRLRFVSYHSLAVIRVIARHLKMGYTLVAIERGGPGYRIDLLFKSPTGT